MEEQQHTSGVDNAHEHEQPPQLPYGDRHCVACRKCHAILTEQQFMTEGCRKCDERPSDEKELRQMTTENFTGFVGLVAPEHSWVARLIGCSAMPNGVYAARLDDEDEEDDHSEGADDDAGGDPEDAYEEEEAELR